MGSEVRNRLIGSTIGLVARHGVAGTGVSELLEAGRVSRRTLYVNFPNGKAELVVEATRAAGQAMSAVVTTLLEETGASSPVLAFAEIWKNVLEGSDFTSGCPIVAATLGRREAPAAADAAGAVFTGWIELLSSWLAEQGVPDRSAEDLATTVVAAVEGAVILSLALHDAAPLERVARQMDTLVALTLPRATS